MSLTDKLIEVLEYLRDQREAALPDPVLGQELSPGAGPADLAAALSEAPGGVGGPGREELADAVRRLLGEPAPEPDAVAPLEPAKAPIGQPQGETAPQGDEPAETSAGSVAALAARCERLEEAINTLINGVHEQRSVPVPDDPEDEEALPGEGEGEGRSDSELTHMIQGLEEWRRELPEPQQSRMLSPEAGIPPDSGEGFWGRITGHTADGNNRWYYPGVEVEKLSAGYGGWTTKAGGRTFVARNTIEDINTAGAGTTLGNGVPVNDLDTAHWTFTVQPCTTNNIVWVHEVPYGDETEYWFEYSNGITGSCD